MRHLTTYPHPNNKHSTHHHFALQVPLDLFEACWSTNFIGIFSQTGIDLCEISLDGATRLVYEVPLFGVFQDLKEATDIYVIVIIR